ncbi:serine hydrolase domain-containing protein [Mycobacteroides abscessus]|uniref:serine hydrolase domain-containing protein n=1 Tax=Mycobacteroides abscessus TaxID=36809 RepID=UPI0009A702FF|nr:serine hydrolase domain-containing protein [Mycobacteroides abscessus]SLG56807.1 beta-lactamase [Mycobacteroides abscessus subsp. abscessus]
MLIDNRFVGLAAKFFSITGSRGHSGGALAVYLRGEPVVDIWGGWAAPGQPWQADTLALAYSTGKGVAATVLHRLVERGLIDYDGAIADYWPEFSARGKSSITVRDLLRHRSGLQRVRGLLPADEAFLDHDAAAAALAAAEPDPKRFKASGYHAVTFGTLVAELAQRASGKSFRDLVRDELATPLNDDDFYFGVPAHQRHRLAVLHPRQHIAQVPVDTVAGVAAHLSPLRGLHGAVYKGVFDTPHVSDKAYDAMMPSWNGAFTARALARMYAAIANGGVVGATPLLRPEMVRTLTKMPFNSRYDYVIGVGLHHSMGYHRAIVGHRLRQDALGHIGIGGSGAIAMPAHGLSVAFITNNLGNALSSVVDGRLPTLAALAGRSVT